MTPRLSRVSPKRRQIHSELCSRLAWVRTTPRGSVVEPDVYWRNATLSAVRSGSHHCSASPSGSRSGKTQRSDRSSGLGFQLAPGNPEPTWPDDAVPQQFHIDVMVDDLDVATERVLALGALRLEPSGQDQHSYVFADPAGHPFCLIPRPSWAPAVGT